MEARLLMAFSNGTGAVIIGADDPAGPARTSIVATFDGPLLPSTAQNVGNYRVNASARATRRLITATGAAVRSPRPDMTPPPTRSRSALARPLARASSTGQDRRHARNAG